MMSLDSSTTQITSSVRRGSVQMRQRSSAETFPQISQKRTVSLTWTSTSASRRTPASSASSRWNAIRCADLGPMPGSLPSSSMRSWTMPSYTGPTVVVRADGDAGRALAVSRTRSRRAAAHLPDARAGDGRLLDAWAAPTSSRYSVPRPRRARPAARQPDPTRSDVVTLPAPLLDAVRERVLTGLSDTTADRSLAEEIAGRVVAYLRNTAETTVSVDEDGTTFVITGDIPAMWLRDSAAQLMPLLRLVAGGVGAEEDRAMLVSLLSGLLRRHWQYIEIDPYANAFNRRPDN